jgi:hypothetical protein
VRFLAQCDKEKLNNQSPDPERLIDREVLGDANRCLHGGGQFPHLLPIDENGLVPLIGESSSFLQRMVC